jgi:serine/threonine protein kinase
MVCFEILSGRVPFHGKDKKGVERQLDHGKHPDRPDFISTEMWELMLKCWSKNPEIRPRMSVVRSSLKEIKSNDLGNVTQISSPYVT